MKKDELKSKEFENKEMNYHGTPSSGIKGFFQKIMRKFVFWHTSEPWKEQNVLNQEIISDFKSLVDETNDIRSNNKVAEQISIQMKKDIEDLKRDKDELYKKAHANYAGIIELQKRAQIINDNLTKKNAVLENQLKKERETTDNEMNLLFYHNRRIQRKLNEMNIDIPLVTSKDDLEITFEDMKQNVKSSELQNDEFEFDYLHFEALYRGSEESIEAKQLEYVKCFEGKDNILDIGCGRGEFVEMLIKNGKQKVLGIDLNKDMVDRAKEKDIPVVYGDALEYLSQEEKLNLGGIFSAQVIEHLTPGQITRLVRAAYYHLEDDGIMILETINPMALITYALSFPMDFTHVRQIHPYTMKFIVESFGFRDAEIVYKAKAKEYKNLVLVNDIMENENLSEYNNQMKGLFDQIYGMQDYAIICRK